MKRKKIKKLNPGPITVMIIISFLLMILSFILNKLGVKGTITDPDTFETTTITVNNFFTKEGFGNIVGSALKNFRAIEPLVAIIVSLITISILEVSGLMNHVFGRLKTVKSGIITFVVLFISIISTIMGDYSYALLFPLVVAIYKVINRDPKLGVMTTFIGITMGYGAGIFYNHQDLILGKLTQSSARNLLDNYTYNSFSLIFITIAATVLLSIVGTAMIEKEFGRKTKRPKEEELIKSRSALLWTIGAGFLMVFLVAWSLIPGLPLSGWMLDETADSYMEKLLGSNAPFREGFVLIILCIALACGYIYGKLSRNIKDSREYNKAISKTFQNTGFIFAGLFFASIMISILNWTNISTVLSANLVEWVGKSQMSGVFLVSSTLIVCIIVTILNPSTVSNWSLMSPVLVGSLARANISPAFTQMIFKAGDSIGKCFSPFYIYFIILLGFMYKADTEDEDINFFGTMRKMLPIVLIMSLTWIIIIVGWNLIGLPLGVHTTTTM